MKTAHKIIAGTLAACALFYAAYRIGSERGLEKGYESGYALAMTENEESQKMYRVDIYRKDKQIERVALVTITKGDYAVDSSDYDAKESLTDIANREINEKRRESATTTKIPFEIDSANNRLNLRIRYDQNIEVMLLQENWIQGNR